MTFGQVLGQRTKTEKAGLIAAHEDSFAFEAMTDARCRTGFSLSIDIGNLVVHIA